MSDKDAVKPPDTSRLQAMLAGVKVAVATAGAVVPAPVLGPVLGASLAEAFGFFGQREIDKRVDRFLDQLVRGFEALQVDVADLGESVWTTAFHAIKVARRTHHQETLDALKNAVLNAATPAAPDDTLQHIFLNMIADLTPLHLRLFGFILHPDRFGMGVEEFDGLHALDPEHPQAAWDVIAKHVAPNTRSDLIQYCFADLVNRELLAYSNAAAPGASQRLFVPYPGSLAWDFYFFISSEVVQPFVGTIPSPTS